MRNTNVSRFPEHDLLGQIGMASAPFPFVFSTPVWGAGHIGLFVDVCLPSLLAPSNLSNLATNRHNVYLIYTRPEDEAALRAASVFHRLSEIMSVKVILIHNNLDMPHRAMSDCHIDSMHRADATDAAAVFVPPDCVWSDGSMVRLETLARSGKTVVYISGVRLDRDTFVSELAAHYTEDRNVLALSARDLVALGLRHLHPIARTHFFEEYDGDLMPANLAWTVPDEGILLRCFHLHPLMVKPQVKFAKFAGTIDDDLVLRACPDVRRHYIVSDSDELLALEMSRFSHTVGTVCSKGSIDGVAAWAEFGANRRHRELIHYCIRIHSRSTTESIWRAKEIETNKIIEAVAELNNLPAWVLLLRNPMVFAGRLNAAVHSRTDRWYLSFLVWAKSALSKLDKKFYGMLFVRNGSPLITHPYWLIRRTICRAIKSCVSSGDRSVVLIGSDRGLAHDIALSYPNLLIRTLVSGVGPCERLIPQADLASIDTLIAIDLPIGGIDSSVALWTGGHRILLRISGDHRAIPRCYNAIVYFGALGTWCCYRIWSWARAARERQRSKTLMIRMIQRLVFMLLSPLLYSGIAFIGFGMNIVGLILDFLTLDRTTLARPRDSISFSQ